MSQFRLAQLSRLGLIVAALGFNLAPAVVGVTSVAYAAGPETVRTEVGTPLKAAIDLYKQKKFKDALVKLQEADGASGKTPYESFQIERTRVTIAQGAGDTNTMLNSLIALISSGRLPAAEQLKFIETVAGLEYQNRDYTKAITWITRYYADGGEDPKWHAILSQSYYLNGDYARAAKELKSDLLALEKSGGRPTETQLQLLRSSASKQGDKAGYMAATEKLVAYYPKKEYWAELINRVRSSPGFSDRLSLDVFRLQMAVGQLSSTNDYMEFSQLALQSGFPAEGVKIITQGFKSGALGTGTDGPRHIRLRDLANKNVADNLKSAAQLEAEATKNPSGIGLVNLGYAYVTEGQSEKGIDLMEQGIRKGEIKHPEDAKLHLAIAYLMADRKAKAIQMFNTVHGTDGTEELAHYWVLSANHAAN